MGYLLSVRAVSYQPSAFSYQLSAISYQPKLQREAESKDKSRSRALKLIADR